MDLDNLSNYTRESVLKEQKLHQLKIEILEDLKTNPKYKEYFDKFLPNSIESFINYYTEDKARWLVYGERYLQNEEEKLLKFTIMAAERLRDIQQKKLFDLQCRWRAELIKIPGIECTLDFDYWEYAIERCPFLTPISEHEFNLFSDFVISDDFYDNLRIQPSWQDYERIKKIYKEDDESNEIPELYKYYYKKCGANDLLLPDIRGEKEEFYSQIAWAEHRKTNAQSNNIPKDPRPFLSHNDENVEQFIKLFEDRKLLRYFKVSRWRHGLNMGDVEDYIYELLDAGEEYPIVAKENWYESLVATSARYIKENLHPALEPAYRNYLSRLDLGLPFEPFMTDEEIKDRLSTNEFLRNTIIKGRILNGEPGDFNF